MARFAESLAADWLIAAPTDAGRAEAMLAAMRMEVPFPSFSSVIKEAICKQDQIITTNKDFSSTIWDAIPILVEGGSKSSTVSDGVDVHK